MVPELFKKLKNKISEMITAMDRKKRIIVLGSIVGGIILLTIFIMLLTRTNYEMVASGLDAAEAKAVTEKLESIGIPYKQNADASTVSVPEKDLSKARMELAVAASVDTISWENVIQSDSITMTSQTREQMIIQARTNQLKKSIETISDIEAAAVILQIPKDSNFFINGAVDSKASVVLTMKPGKKLSQSQVSGIVHLVASAAKGLESDHVVILDQSGIQLNRTDPGSMEYELTTQYELMVQQKTKMQQDITTFLEKLYGRGNVEIEIALVLDFDKLVEKQVLFSPPVEGETEGLIRSLTRINENVKQGAAVGVPGTDSNVGEPTSVAEGGDEGSYIKASETLNYELNQVVRDIEKAQGTIKDINIGVLLNTSVLKDNTFTAEHKSELLGIIATSAGTNVDNISIMAREFSDPMAGFDQYTAGDQAGTLFGLPIWAIIITALVTIALVVGVIIIIKLRKSKADKSQLEEIAEELDDMEELEINDDKGSPKYHIEKFVDKNPEAAANLLRAWLNE